MENELFIKKLLSAAKEAGIEAAEVYFSSDDNFRAMANRGEVNNYSVSTRGGLSLRGLYKGKMGYASSEANDDEAVSQLVRGVVESAELNEDEDVQEIYKGDESYPAIDNYAPALDQVTEQEKLALLLDMERRVLENGDERVKQAGYNMVSTSSGSVRLVNSYGLDLKTRDNIAFAYIVAIAKEGERVATGTGIAISRDFKELSAEKIAKDAVEEALFNLGASPVPSGSYRVIIINRCMPDILAVFSGIFSAENAQKGMSLLAGREGEEIASSCVTLLDDPHRPGGLDSRAFDDEGVATRLKAVVENGKLTTLLHNLKTARKAGVKTTGNASKRGYSSPIGIAPSNFYFKPGEKTLEQMMADIGEGLVITDVDGLHAGANPMSGDFSLLAKGYTVTGGKKGRAVEQITVAGNFYTLMKNIRALGSDLVFPDSGFGSPSVDIGEISVAGS